MREPRRVGDFDRRTVDDVGRRPKVEADELAERLEAAVGAEDRVRRNFGDGAAGLVERRRHVELVGLADSQLQIRGAVFDRDFDLRYVVPVSSGARARGRRRTYGAHRAGARLRAGVRKGVALEALEGDRELGLDHGRRIAVREELHLRRVDGCDGAAIGKRGRHGPDIGARSPAQGEQEERMHGLKKRGTTTTSRPRRRSQCIDCHARRISSSSQE